MRYAILWMFLALAAVHASSGNARDFAPEHCGSGVVSEPTLYSSDFRWGYELSQMISRFAEIYESPKRLGHRAYFDSVSGGFKLPYDQAYGGDVRLPLSFVSSVRRHIEEALRLEYINAVYFPDMGHSHFLLPAADWDKKYAEVPVNQFTVIYEKMMLDPDLKILYHTAEQLKMKDDHKELLNDRRVQERFFTRNLVGENRGENHLEILQNLGHSMNTVQDVDGYHWWGAGFNISANKNGCFVYLDHGIEKFFDISLYDLEPAPQQVASTQHF